LEASFLSKGAFTNKSMDFHNKATLNLTKNLVFVFNKK
jgi:hypothetical protein